ncbi:helix-turn-helix domain-containing protein [Plebeiibacterium sediminum]|uniref:Helix-turn-helix domain-containing protein n=1 Tax=Plebeiibacterium sediminum TaxID=2992112 RepID=A0AAE3M271_9BACT|nr:helix-turn-helix domain-containing protein [Plebeiobacterium sediminum]MCW3785487.1 helix-turn-helix domain-containing protein [Plebeiobacterium sediminum]
MMEVMQALLKLSGELKEIKIYLQQFYKTRLEKFSEAWIDGQDVMQVLHISKRTLQTLRDNGSLPCSRINGKFYYKLSDIENMLESNYSPLKKPSDGVR